MTVITMARSATPEKSPPFASDLFAAQCSLSIACLATERLADLAAAGDRDLEGLIADLLMHLRAVSGQLDRAMG